MTLLNFWSNVKVYVIQNSPILGQGRNLVPSGFPYPKLFPLGLAGRYKPRNTMTAILIDHET